MICLHQALVAVCEHLDEVCGIYFLNQWSNPGPLHWEHGVLATGSPRKALLWHFWITSKAKSYSNFGLQHTVFTKNQEDPV